MFGMMENWDYPIISKFKEYFGGAGLRGRFGILPSGLRWSDVIDPVETTGSPPALDTDTIIVTHESSPFSIKINQRVKFTHKVIREGDVQSEDEVVVDQAPYTLSVTEDDIYKMTTSMREYIYEYKLTEIIKDELINRYLPRKSGIP